LTIGRAFGLKKLLKKIVFPYEYGICVAIWETGEWPEEWTFSTFIPLPKKSDLKQCANYRTIALSLPRKQDPSSDHTGEDPSKDRNGNCR